MPSRDLKVTLIGSDQTGKAFGSASKAADGMGSKFAGIGKAAAIGLGGAAVGFAAFAKNGVDAFARVEDALSNADVQFGAAAPTVVKFAEGAAKSLGMSKGAALDAANTFATMGKAAGMSGGDLAQFSTKFTGLAGDLASFKGTSPEQAIEAIGAALRGETEPIRAYGVMLDDASLRQEALSQGLIKTTKEALTPQQKVLAAQALIYKQTTDAQGDYQRTSDSTANVQKTLTATTEDASAKLGKQLAPAVTMAREAFLGLIQGASGFVEKIGPAVATAQVAFSAFFDALREGDVTSDGLVGKFEMVGDALHRFGKVAIPVAKQALEQFIGAVQTAGKLLVDTVQFFREHENAAKALGAVVATVAAAVVAAWVLQAAQATIAAARQVAAWMTVATTGMLSGEIQKKTTAQIVVGWAVSAAKATASAARHVAAWVLMGAQSLAQAARVAAAWLIAMGPIGLVIAAVVGLVVVIVKNWDTIKQVIGAGWDWVKAKTVAVWDGIKAVTSAAWAAIRTAFSVALEAVKIVVTTYFNAYKAVITGALNVIKGAVSAGWSAIKGAFSSALGAIQTAVSGGIVGVVQLMAALPRRILSGLGNLSSLLVGAGRSLLSGLAKGIGDAVGSVVARAKDAAKAVVGAVKGAFGINSPSRVFAEIGGQLGAGMEQGLERSQRRVTRAAADLVDLTGMKMGGAGYINGRLRASAAGSPAEGAPAQPVARNLTVNINGQVERLDEDRIMTLIQRAERLAGQ